MDTLTNTALLRLLQLASPALPVGAYSYSEGLETLVQSGTIQTATDLEHWIVQELQRGAVRLEAAIALRTYHAMQIQDFNTILYWNDWLTAARETEELRSQSLQMGRSLLRLFQQLESAALPNFESGCNFAVAFGVVAAVWNIEVTAMTIAYLHSWATNLISAGVKLIPLGQTAGQQLLLQLNTAIQLIAQTLDSLADHELESCGWGLSIASMNHETLYSRLFRS